MALAMKPPEPGVLTQRALPEQSLPEQTLVKQALVKLVRALPAVYPLPTA